MLCPAGVKMPAGLILKKGGKYTEEALPGQNRFKPHCHFFSPCLVPNHVVGDLVAGKSGSIL
ncbi:hypothetical protein DZS_21570 [Dickeya ananatis]